MAQNTRFCVILCVREELEAFAKGAEFPEGIPAQVVDLGQLLNVFWRRAAGPRFKQAAAVHQLNNRQHFGRCAQFEDREEIRQIITQNVARDRDGILACADGFEGATGCRPRRHNLKLIGHTSRSKDRLDIFEQFGVMRACRV